MAVRHKTTLALGAARSSGGYLAEVMADAPAALWMMDELAGATQFLDTSAAATYPASISGSPTFAGASAGIGISGTSVAFSGTQSATATSPIWLTGQTAYSVECWFKTSSTGTVGIGGHDDSSSNRFLQFRCVNGQLQAIPFTASGSAFTAQNSTTGIYDNNAWHHALATVQNNGGTNTGFVVLLYADGVQVGTASTGTSGIATAASPTFLIGSLGAVGGTMTGSLDAFAVYTTALPAARASAHYHAGIGS